MKKKILLMLFPLLAMSLTACDKGNPDPGPTPSPVEKEVESLTVKTPPTKTEYVAGKESFDKTGMVITVKYTDGSTKDIDDGWTVTPAGILNESDTKVTITYGEKSVDVPITVKGDTPTPPVEGSLKEAYEAAVTEAGKETAEFSFSGTFVGSRVNGTQYDYYVQDGEYGVDVFQYEAIEGFAVGKKVTIKSTLQLINGTVETKTISSLTVGNVQALPTAVVIDSSEKLAGCKQNILLNATGEISSIGTVSDGTKDLTVKLTVNGSEIPVFFKKNSYGVNLDILKTLAVGDTITVNGAVKGVYVKDGNTTHQMLACGETIIQKGSEPIGPRLSIDKTTLSIAKGETDKITATVLGTEETVTWSSSAEAVATVDQDGTVHGVAKGNAVITAALTTAGLSKECRVTVTDDTPSPIIVETEYELTKESLQLSNVYTSNDKGDIGWVDLYGQTDPVSIQGNKRAESSTKTALNSEIYNINEFSKEIKKVEFACAKDPRDNKMSIFFGTAKQPSGNEIKLGKDSEHTFAAGQTTTVDAPAGCKYFDIKWTEFSSNFSSIKFIFGEEQPSIESVTVTPASGSVEVNKTLKLSANVVAKGTASKEVQWSSSNNEVATVDQDGTVHGVAVSDQAVTITATSKFDGTKSGSASITVIAERVLTGIEVTTNPDKTTYTAGESFDPTGMVVTATYSDLDTAPITDYTYMPNGALIVDDTVITVSYGGFDDTVDITVNPKPVVDGTLYDFTKIDGFSSWASGYNKHVVEYTDATITFSAASKQSSTIDNMPVSKAGEVAVVAKAGKLISKFTGTFKQWNDKNQTVDLYYSTDGGANYTKTDVSSKTFAIPTTALPEETNAVKVVFSATNQIGIESFVVKYAEQRTLDHIAVTSDPTITTYDEGQAFDPSGMVVTAYYDNGDEEVITDYDYSPKGALTVEDEEITVSYQEKTDTVAITVNEVSYSLSSIEIDSTSKAETNYYAGQSFNPEGLVILAHFSDPSKDKTISWGAEGLDYSPKGALAKGDETVEISYTFGEDTKTVDLAISVSDAPTPVEDVVETLTAESLGLGSGYADFSKVQSSGILFQGNGTVSTDGGIQIKDTANGSGIYSRTSGRLVKSIKFEFDNINGKTISVYGKAEGYTSVEATPSGTLLGSLTAEGTIDVTEEVKNIFITSTGATYIKDIIITYAGGTVTPVVSGVSLNKSTADLGVGDNLDLSAIVDGSGCSQNVTWETSDSDKATVENGVVTGVAAGTVTITAKSVDDNTKSAQCIVTVTAEKTLMCADFTTKAAANSDYNATWDYGDFSLTGAANNNGQWNYIKLGAKNKEQTATICSTVAATAEITKIVAELPKGSFSKTGQSCSEWGVYVYSDAEMTNEIDHVISNDAIVNNASTFTLTPTSSKHWTKGCYFKVYFKTKDTGGNNGVVWLSKVSYIG